VIRPSRKGRPAACQDPTGRGWGVAEPNSACQYLTAWELGTVKQVDQVESKKKARNDEQQTGEAKPAETGHAAAMSGRVDESNSGGHAEKSNDGAE